MKNFSLAHGEKFVTESTLIKIVSFLFKKQLKLFHEYSTNELILSLLEHVKSIQGNFSGHLSYNL